MHKVTTARCIQSILTYEPKQKTYANMVTKQQIPNLLNAFECISLAAKIYHIIKNIELLR